MPRWTLPAFAALLAAPAAGCIIIQDSGDGGSPTTGPAPGPGTLGPSTAGSTGPASTSTSTSTGASDTGTAGSGDTAGTAGTPACGWGPTGVPDPAEGYVCGGQGSDPDGVYPLACPDGLAEGSPCGEVTGVGCCDAAGDLWYCTATGTLYRQACE